MQTAHRLDVSQLLVCKHNSEQFNVQRQTDPENGRRGGTDWGGRGFEFCHLKGMEASRDGRVSLNSPFV